MEAIRNPAATEHRRRIGELAEQASSEGFKRRVERMMGLVTDFKQDKLKKFLSFNDDERVACLEFLESLQKELETVSSSIVRLLFSLVFELDILTAFTIVLTERISKTSRTKEKRPRRKSLTSIVKLTLSWM